MGGGEHVTGSSPSISQFTQWPVSRGPHDDRLWRPAGAILCVSSAVSCLPGSRPLSYVLIGPHVSLLAVEPRTVPGFGGTGNLHLRCSRERPGVQNGSSASGLLPQSVTGTQSDAASCGLNRGLGTQVSTASSALGSSPLAPGWQDDHQRPQASTSLWPQGNRTLVPDGWEENSGRVLTFFDLHWTVAHACTCETCGHKYTGALAPLGESSPHPEGGNGVWLLK